MFYTTPKTYFELLCLAGRCDIGLLCHCNPIHSQTSEYFHIRRIADNQQECEPPVDNCHSTCRLGRNSSLPPQQSVCAQIYGASVNLPLRHTDNPLKVMVTVLVYGNPIA